MEAVDWGRRRGSKGLNESLFENKVEYLRKLNACTKKQKETHKLTNIENAKPSQRFETERNTESKRETSKKQNKR